jgi:hypothetical protein
MIHEEEDFNKVIQKVYNFTKVDESECLNVYVELLWHILSILIINFII